MVGGLFDFDESVKSMMFIDHTFDTETCRTGRTECDSLLSVMDAENRRGTDSLQTVSVL